MINIDGKKLIIFDADGTLRRCTVPGQPCPNKPGEWEVLPGVREKLAVLDPCCVAIASNQGGVGLGLLTSSMALSLLSDLAREVFTPGQMNACRIYICPHPPKAGCRCRKPSPLMLFQAMECAEPRGPGILPAETLYVGDMDSDREAAQRAGVDFMWAWQFFGWPAVTMRVGEAERDELTVEMQTSNGPGALVAPEAPLASKSTSG